ncbi:Protein CBG10582 [Caenorhabditis briggsae]|uniref:Protein CBG10582 n=1 Tax=Caenorhabditis briggsae TaxID=6238 RepID=A8XBF1_CAEBR|nr:Protein CBG10582 [Caenorhabditis briggsae]CAP29966.2 Protein CBG10582 [Caenorhabditis briggsae]
MSVLKGFVLDDDGIHGNFSLKDSSAYSASENDFLEQKMGKMMQKCNFENQNAVQQTIQNLQKFSKLSGNGAYSMLLPLISLIKEKDNDSFKQVADHDDVVKRIRVSWQEEREGRKRIPNFVVKICEWMLDNGLRSVEELEEEWKAAQQRRLDLISLLENNTVQLECARKRAYDQTAKCEQIQKEFDYLKMKNRKLFKQLEGARSKFRKMKVSQESEQKQIVSEKERSSVGSSENNVNSFEHIEKKNPSQVELQISESEVAKIVLIGVRTEKEVCDHKVENGFLSNGQSEFDTMILKENSTEDKVDESVCTDIKDESTEGNVEDSKVVLCSGDQQTDEFQRCRTKSTQDNIKDFKEIVASVSSGYRVSCSAAF